MSNINDKATITLQVNGQQAKQMLRDLEKEADRTEKAITKMKNSGADPKAVKQQEKNLASIRRELERMRKQVVGVEDVFRDLDKATPKRLKDELRKLKKEVDGLQPGSKVWDEHKRKIKQLEERLRSLNGQVNAQKSVWQKFTEFMNNGAVAIVAVIAMYSQGIEKLRKYVGDFADMEEEIANSVKYTRMSREEVERLNEAFKTIDTRLSREQLNELAQEAGRLGKNTVESVQGYVEAAQIINVALVDLGDGATQTIAKIANIFGMEELYGTKEAMLKVGSAVNHLSQNCTASKPYLVNFAQRMAGIGSTAKMTIPEILAFGAVLDANGQKVEMSSTAISNTIMKLFQQTSKFAQITGMDVQKFTEVLNRNTTEGLIMFLEQLKKVSGGSEAKAIATLAPLFKDLGLNGARITQVLATMTQHLDELRWQIGEANEAFREGVSASNEFEIFNNTAQASIEKAKNRIHELSIELGEKLYPLMAHLMTTSSMWIKTLNVVVGHIIKHGAEYSKLAKTIGIYVGALAAAKLGQMAWTAATALSTKTVAAFKTGMVVINGILPALKLGYVAAANAVTYFTNGLNVNNAMQQRWTAATAAARTGMKGLNNVMKANVFAAVATVAVTLVMALRSLKKETSEYQKEVKDAMRNVEGITEASLKERKELDTLFGTLKGAKQGTSEYEGAKKKIIDQYGIYLRGLINERGEIIDLARAYSVLSDEIDKSNRLRGIRNVRQNVEESFFKSLAESLDKFKEALIKAGASESDASRLKVAVGQYMSSGEQLPDDLMREINRYRAAYVKSRRMSWDVMDNLQPFKGNPREILDSMISDYATFSKSVKELDAMTLQVDRWAGTSTAELKSMLRRAQQRFYQGRRAEDDDEPRYKIDLDGQTKKAMVGDPNMVGPVMEMSFEEASRLISELPSIIAKREAGKTGSDKMEDVDDDGFETYTAAETSGSAKADRFSDEKAAKEKRIAEAMISKALGYIVGPDGKVTEFTDFDYEKELVKIDKDYYLAILKRGDLTELERQKARVGYYEAEAKMKAKFETESIEEENKAYKESIMAITQAYADGVGDAEHYNKLKEQEELRHLRRIMEIYRKQASAAHEKWEAERAEAEMSGAEFSSPEPPAVDSDIYWGKYMPAKQQYADKIAAGVSSRSQAAKAARAEFEQTKQRYLSMMGVSSAKDRAKNYKQEMSALFDVYENEKAAVRDEYGETKKGQDELLKLQRGFEIAKLTLAKKYGMEQTDAYKKAVRDFADWLGSDGGKAVVGAMSTMTSGMSEVFSGLSTLMEADIDVQTKAIERRYEKELSAAEGNSYRIAKLERQKEEEIAKVKNSSSRRQFVMQVIQAMAQTATNALNAFGSAAAIPVVGHILAPIAASMAVAAGMLQVAAIKKQQQAASSAGYSRGGFTPDGGVDEPAGIVHRGEWVASQRLTKSPAVRPVLDALEYMQRYNVLPSVSQRQVSASVSAPAEIAKALQSDSGAAVMAAVVRSNTEAMRGIDRRLAEPSAAVVTVSGDYGIARAQEDYNRYRRSAANRKNKAKWS